MEKMLIDSIKLYSLLIFVWSLMLIVTIFIGITVDGFMNKGKYCENRSMNLTFMDWNWRCIDKYGQLYKIEATK